MPSPSQGKRVSSTSVGRQSAAALRRGEVKISDPIPLPRDKLDDALQPDQDISNQRSATDGTWPRRSTPPETDARPGSDSGRRGLSQLAVNRESAGHSAILSTMSSKNSMKQRKSGGFRATIRSLFGSKRHRSSLSNDRSFHISVRGQNLLSSLPLLTQKLSNPLLGKILCQYHAPEQFRSFRSFSPWLPHLLDDFAFRD
jgi:hypothetical protein